MSQIHLLYKRLPAKLRTALEIAMICLGLMIFTLLSAVAKSQGGIVLFLFVLIGVVLFSIPHFSKKFKTWREQASYEKRFFLHRNHAMTTTRHGSLEAYYEQGWEGDFLQAFSPDLRPCDQKQRLPMILRYGDHLTVYSKTDEIVWQGFVFNNHSSRWKLPGARPALQPMWFWQSNRAELTRLPDSLHCENANLE